MTAIRLRPLRREDQQQVLQLGRATFPHDQIDDDIIDVTLSEENFAADYHVLFVAEADDTIVGYVVARPWTQVARGGADVQELASSTTLELHHLAVAPAFNSRGVGKALLDAVVGRAHELKIGHLVTKAPTVSAGFYVKAGWNVAREDERFAWLEPALDLRAKLMDSNARPSGAFVFSSRADDRYPVAARYAIDRSATIACRLHDGDGLAELVAAVDGVARPDWLTDEYLHALRETAQVR